MSYLTDDEIENVKVENRGSEIYFEILQGSKMLIGTVNDKKVRVEATIAIPTSFHVSYLRQLVTQNYKLEYSRYALDDNGHLTIIFDSFIQDASPYKLYYALKEMAVNADKQDDLLIDEFTSLQNINTGHIIKIAKPIKSVMYDFLIAKIDEVNFLFEDDSLRISEYPQSGIYLLLNLAYKIDYLLKPEGFTMESLEKIHRIYHQKSDSTLHEIISQIRKELNKLRIRSRDEIFEEFYNVRSTFGITAPSNHQQVQDIIENDIGQMDWYIENNQIEVVRSICGFICGYTLFYYAPPLPILQLMSLYYWLCEPQFYENMGYSDSKEAWKGTELNKRVIKNKIKQICGAFGDKYPFLKPDYSILNFEKEIKFWPSYLLFMRSLDLTQIDQ